MTFDKERQQRYRGHLSLCEIDLPGQQKIAGARVMVIGAGGLGSPVALYLAGAGVGTIKLVDPDEVSLSNLQRQIIHTTGDIGRPKVLSAREKMVAINPDVKVDTFKMRLSEDNAAAMFEDCDVVVDCTDNLCSRLLINDTCVATGTPMVFGSVSRFSGQLFTYIPGSADYRAIFDCDAPSDDLPCSVNGVLNSVVGVIGSLQATEVIKLITGAGDPLVNRLLLFDAITMTFNEFAI